MSDEAPRTASELMDGLVQLRFSDDEGKVKDINAAEMADALQGLVSFTSQMAKTGLFGDGMPPEVRVRPAQEGSFILEAVLQWASENPEGAVGSGLAAGGTLMHALNVGIRKLRGDKPTNFEYLDNGNVKVNWQDGTVSEAPAQSWKRLNDMKNPTRKALRDIMAPLSDDVDRLEVRDGRPTDSTQEILESAPEVVADKGDYRIAAAEVDDSVEEIETFEAEAKLQSIDFRSGEKWHILTRDGGRKATIEDDEFLAELDRGMALHKNDIFDVTIRETRTLSGKRTKRDWVIIKAVRKRRGGDDDSAPSPSAQSEAEE